MIFGIPIADIIIGTVALLLVGLCIYSIIRKKKKCCTKCSGCQQCVTGPNGCPVEAISFGKDGKVVIDQELCVGCGICKSRCNRDVIKIKQTMPMRKDIHDYFEKDFNIDLKLWNE